MLLVEQRADAALALADHAYVMATGEVVAEGPASELRSDERVRKAYLGEPMLSPANEGNRYAAPQ